MFDGIKGIDIFGFDLDGTLYDEFDFISQAYHQFASIISQLCYSNIELIYKYMIGVWFINGSSYDKLFQDTLLKFKARGDISEIVEKLIKVYRTFDFNIVLSERIKAILDWICENGYSLFMVTDGNPVLQAKKITALGLEYWFDKNNIVITGAGGVEYSKPSTKSLQQIEMLNKIKTNSDRILYFGDRNVDYQFAKNAGFLFKYMKNGIIIE